MKSWQSFSLYRLLVVPLLVSLALTACAPTPKAAPTKAPPPTLAPANISPTQVPPSKPVNTEPPKPTVAPTKVATSEPTAVPTLAPVTQPTPQTLPLGTQELIGDLMVIPSKFQSVATSGTDKPKAGDQYLFVTISLENTSKTATVKFDPASLVLVDPTGNTNIAMVTLKSLGNELKAQELKPGAKIEGVIAYEVPQTDTQLELMLRTGNNQEIFWKLEG